MTKEEIIQAIETMSVLELSELVKALEEKFGVSASAAPVMMAAMPGAGAAAAPAEEKTEFDVVYKGPGANKIAVIKAVREITNVKEGVSKEEAEELRKKLAEAGADVEVK